MTATAGIREADPEMPGYLTSPFPGQPQPIPGQPGASEPDHGEQSYVVSAKLAGKSRISPAATAASVVLLRSHSSGRVRTSSQRVSLRG